MNHGYEYDVNVAPGGKIIREITFVDPARAGAPNRTQIMCQIIDTCDSMTRDALVELGWAPPAPRPPAPHADKNDPLMERQKVYGRGYEEPPRYKQCLVKGCTNHIDRGKFVGDICWPCYDMLRSGRASSAGTTFVHSMHDRLQHIATIAV